MKNKFIKNKGFTLIELIVAMSVSSLIALAFFMIINVSIKSNKKSEIDIKALQVAQTEMENIREQIKSGKKIEFKNQNNEDIIEGRDYYININKVNYVMEIELNKENNNNMFEVEVIVRNEDEKFSNRNVELKTRVFGG